MTLNNLVGNDIRALRKSRGATIKELSATLGRSVGWLSQVERGQATPSITDIAAIANNFGVNISFFFRSANRDPDEQGIVLRAADRIPIGSSESGLIEELLSPTLGGTFEMIKSTFAPRSSSDGLRAARQSEDGGVLISGQLTLEIDDLTLALEAGDSFQFTSRTYSWRNNHDTPAVAVWVISPPVY
ncbi:XRE family transcriptional regulator [Defluviimonas sp. 20V17]|uniref:Transcriptional regulator, XRE family with cupin sensor n=1 Tax=Allgaiera indica TaxID=765699 RepID=A0AAN4UT72_9RHOB|nr:helix-turn-helix domain-containing protein [Allgaiera indica]KDB04039.1 XRE family transcriptional regulator [Defluviimonas sp. 20V17]GHE03823.1 XRE family transcriptional regulator [Allgaiera indica]SDX37060.1 transcriptional regulator, XRE family with cupin sensor [Allgaiera indica]